jgi:hypothetical protein
MSSNSHDHFGAEATHYGHKGSGSHLGGYHDERITKETHITKFGDSAQSPELLRTGSTLSGDDHSEVFHDARSRASTIGDSALNKRVGLRREDIWVENVAAAANGGALKKVTHIEKGWDTGKDSHSEVYNFMEEKRKVVPGISVGGKVITEPRWWDSSRGNGYK